MEGGPKQERVSSGIENAEYSESIEQAEALLEKLKSFHETDVVGKEGIDEVEALASALTIELKGIPPEVRIKAGLPYHPMEAVNDNVPPQKAAA